MPHSNIKPASEGPWGRDATTAGLCTHELCQGEGGLGWAGRGPLGTMDPDPSRASSLVRIPHFGLMVPQGWVQAMPLWWECCRSDAVFVASTCAVILNFWVRWDVWSFFTPPFKRSTRRL